MGMSTKRVSMPGPMATRRKMGSDKPVHQPATKQLSPKATMVRKIAPKSMA